MIRGAGSHGARWPLWWSAAGVLVAGALAYWAMGPGPGLSPDSLRYLLLARSLAHGQGFRLLGEPMTHFPPGYPALLALAGAVGADSLPPARALHAALFALNAALVAWAAKSAAGADSGAAPLALLLLISPSMLTVHAMAWSEPPFIALTLGAALLLSARAAGAGRGALLGAAGCLALALLVRYAGLALVPAALLAVVLWRRHPLRVRLLDAALLGLIGVGPLALWLLRNAGVAGSATDRALAFHPVGLGYLEQLVHAAAELWGLGSHPAWCVLALLPLASFLLAARRMSATAAGGGWGQEDSAASFVQGFAVLACASYAAFLLLSLCFVDADTPVDVRLLSPVHVFAVALVAALPAQLRRAGRPRAARASLLVLAALGAVHLGQSGAAAVRFRRSGEGFNSRYWRESATLAGVRSLASGSVVFSNGPEIVALFTGRDVLGLPVWASRTSLQRRPEYPREQAAVCRAVEQGALVVYLDGIHWAWDLPTEGELQDACRLEVRRRFADGTVYTASQAGPRR